ncbi:MAG: DUF488 family protein [Terriglobia bacterium]
MPRAKKKPNKKPKQEPFRVFTIGHSTRPIGKFIELLELHGVKKLVDVRTVPRSRHNPQFNKDALPDSLRKASIRYVHRPGLGGLRHARRDSINRGWENVSFRGFADYMQEPGFEQSVEALLKLAAKTAICIMCAEAVPWRCHRSLIADALTVRGVQVEHITGGGKTLIHSLTSFAKVKGQSITYPAPLAHHAVTASKRAPA